jgi:hypothetical protein
LAVTHRDNGRGGLNPVNAELLEVSEQVGASPDSVYWPVQREGS